MTLLPDVMSQHYMKAAFEAVLTHPAGFGVELGCDLWIARLEDGQFRVARHDAVGAIIEENLFKDVQAAIDWYFVRYKELQLGLEFESESESKP